MIFKGKRYANAVNFLDAYRIGDIYISTSPVDPSGMFGGSWRAINGKFLLGRSSAFPAGSTGGNKDAVIPAHTHSDSSTSITSSGSHSHSYTYNIGTNEQTQTSKVNRYVDSASYYGLKYGTLSIPSSGEHTHKVSSHYTGYEGDEELMKGANMPPFQAVYMWERIA